MKLWPDKDSRLTISGYLRTILPAICGFCLGTTFALTIQHRYYIAILPFLLAIAIGIMGYFNYCFHENHEKVAKAADRKELTRVMEALNTAKIELAGEKEKVFNQTLADRKEVVQMILFAGAAVLKAQITDDSCSIRGNVFQLRRLIAEDNWLIGYNGLAGKVLTNDEVFYVAYQCSMDQYDDQYFILPKNTGLTGKTWNQKLMLVADLTRKTDPKHGPVDWGLTPEQLRRVPSELKAIISVPIPHPDDRNQLLGVLNFDSTFPLEESRFHITLSSKTGIAQQARNALDRLLRRTHDIDEGAMGGIPKSTELVLLALQAILGLILRTELPAAPLHKS